MKLNVEQRKIVELEPNGHMMVKGVAGSGKTTVSIRRIPFLHQNYCHENDDRILLVTYNKTLLSYIKHQYEKLQEEEQDLLENLFQTNAEVQISTIDKLMFYYFMKYQKRHQSNLELASQTQERQVLNRVIHYLKEQYQDIKIISPKYTNFLLDEVSWINACQIETEEEYQTIDRVGRATGGENSPQKLLKNSTVRAAIFHLMDVFNQALAKEGFITFKKANLLALKEAQQVNHGKFTHIIIDESQDLTKVQLEFLKHVYQGKTHSSIMFVADNTQSIYSQSWLGKGRPYTSIGYDMSGKSRTLSKNYRTTTEISEAAYQLIEHDETIQSNVDFVKPSLIDRSGPKPIYRFFLKSEDQMNYYVQEIKSLQADYRLSDICIVAREKRSLEDLSLGLNRAGIANEELNTSNPNFDSEKVKLVTMHSIKGLEFKVILLVDLNDGILPNDQLYDFDEEKTMDTEERKLLYVGMTRANELLYMSSVRKPSKFIKDLDFDHLRMQRDSKMKPFQSIALNDYMKKDAIFDLNSKEEAVRQWLTKQLIATYGYTTDLIDFEYPVQQFSKRGYVDVVVSIFHNGEKVPYIFAEVKRFGDGIEEATEQLKSYMNTNDTVRYGVITDGIDLLVTDRDDIVNDIPPCQPHFLPETKYKQTYMNIKTQRAYQYLTEINDPNHVEIKDTEAEMTMDYNEYLSVPVVGNVAAGIPSEAIEALDHMIELPKDWTVSEQDTFALTVTGDSMVNAGIDRGDTVIVNRQNTAENHDIVIAVIDQEATMKRLMLMGGSVLLIPENSEYEPIHMNHEDVMINGKVIGVLKKR
ncbi:transcriptional repressor LexA [Halalkalibacillus halophilus]|uniref:transcriptional repressor LexA n=1 Tax=Halalkalibacillus halophilus TaxID=392827 RepID=UPI0004290F0E|nr:transcriptional repressor LexA [Halalkalibacillus halophilus]